MILRVDFELSEDDLLLLKTKGIIYGYHVEFPRKGWLTKDTKECCRLAIQNIIKEWIANRRKDE